MTDQREDITLHLQVNYSIHRDGKPVTDHVGEEVTNENAIESMLWLVQEQTKTILPKIVLAMAETILHTDLSAAVIVDMNKQPGSTS